jgi:4-hydroxy-tetrahydrodipicolinate synthase
MSLREKFTGTGVAIITPLLENGSVDWDSFKKVIEHIIIGKCEYIVVLGTTGESATIHGEEKQQIFSFVSNINAGRVALVAGIGSNDTSEVLSGFKNFNLTGYDAILNVSPYYNKPNQEGIYQHYKLLNEHTPLPIMMYNVPSRTGQNITAETQLKIAENCKNIFATKEASGNMEQVMHILSKKPKDFMVISGDDAITLPMIACGAEGVVSVIANAYPAGFSDMVRFCLAGRFEEARPLHYRYLSLIHAIFAEGSPGGIKAILSELGLCKNAVRLPVWPVSNQHHLYMQQLMKDVL